jgi:hypothetical protein
MADHNAGKARFGNAANVLILRGAAPSFPPLARAVVAQLVRAPDCGSGGRWFDPTRLYQSNLTEPQSSNRYAKTAALGLNFARRVFTIDDEETLIRENSAPFAASLYLQSGDLHFTPQARVGVCAQPVGALELSALVQK